MSENSGDRKNIDYQRDHRPDRVVGSSSSSATEKVNTAEPRKKGQSYMDSYRPGSDRPFTKLFKEALEDLHSGGDASSVAAEHGSEAGNTSAEGGDVPTTDSVVAEHGSDAGSASGRPTHGKIRGVLRLAKAEGSEVGETDKAGGKVIIAKARYKSKKGDEEGEK